MSYQKLILLGNVGRIDIQTIGENTVAKVSLATSEKYKDRNGEEHENTEWHNLVLWRKQAELVEKYVNKGDQLFVEGKLRTRKYTTKDGEERQTTEVVVDTIQFIKRGDKPKQESYQDDMPDF